MLMFYALYITLPVLLCIFIVISLYSIYKKDYIFLKKLYSKTNLICAFIHITAILFLLTLLISSNAIFSSFHDSSFIGVKNYHGELINYN